MSFGDRSDLPDSSTAADGRYASPGAAAGSEVAGADAPAGRGRAAPGHGAHWSVAPVRPRCAVGWLCGFHPAIVRSRPIGGSGHHRPAPAPDQPSCEDQRQSRRRAPYSAGPPRTVARRRAVMTNTRTRIPQDLDRNLALDLVRVTEAAAMAAGRWVGRGDKEGGDGAAVDAMRKLINSIPMRGVVVIGEGEKDNAPMLFNGEARRRRQRPGGGRRGRPGRRHHPDEQGHAERAGGARRRRAGCDVRPERRLLHGEARGRPRRTPT